MTIVFERAGFVQPLQMAKRGNEAVAYLRGDGPHADRARFPFPALVLLDLNMPGMNGFEVLAWIREQPALKQLPVHILSASSRVNDRERALQLGADSYLVKPTNLDGLMRLAHAISTWLRLHEALVEGGKSALSSPSAVATLAPFSVPTADFTPKAPQ